MSPKIILVFYIVLFPLAVMAHGTHGTGVLSGFTHPILGLDHAIAILALGILGYLLKPGRWYLLLLAFTISMILGGLLGITKEATFLIEKIIAFSVLFLGLFIAFDFRIKIGLILILSGIFGAVHGYAHGAEMDSANTALKYISGYTLGTLLVGTIGMHIAKITNSLDNKRSHIKIIGGTILGAGVVILLS